MTQRIIRVRIKIIAGFPLRSPNTTVIEMQFPAIVAQKWIDRQIDYRRKLLGPLGVVTAEAE